MNTRFSVVFSLVFVSIQNHATGTVQCAHADLSKLQKAVYVSPAGNDTAACGQSMASPCKSIQQGIANCDAGSCGVLVRYGTYAQGNPVNVADGVSLYGSCVFDETTYPYRSTIIGNPAIQATGVNKPTVIEGFVILGGAALNASQASVAFAVSNSTGLVLRENVIASGKGGNGANGNTRPVGEGQNGFRRFQDIGGEGGVGCPSNPPPGSTGRGGKGADWQRISSSCNVFTQLCDCSNPNFPASVGQDGGNSASVPGGAGGQRGSAGCACGKRENAGRGPAGGSGNAGAPGTEGGSPNPDSKGSFAGITWRPNFGGTGTAGQVGSGGGGGGSGGFSALFASGTNRDGYPGGGGGGGGCGGPGGTSGQQGGASIPLVLFASSLAGLAASNALIPGPGGQGGDGGIGARGGRGGYGGNGYYGPQIEVKASGISGSCSGVVPGLGGVGGDGGPGGAGAGGAGGNGGPSFAIALVNSSPLPASDFIFYPAQPGRRGNLGPGGQNNATNKGQDGKPGIDGFSNDSIVSFTSTNLPGGANQ